MAYASDRQVTEADLQVVADHLGATTASADWAIVATADADGQLTITDLTGVSQWMIYDDGSFDLIEASTIDKQAAMNAGVTTSVAITHAYLDCIDAYDHEVVDPAVGGRALNSIISVSDVAIQAAADADAVRASQGMTSMLLGVPIAVKDNYDTVDMPTTGSSLSC
ncbi:amidase family protein [Luethyella okanaganae]|uniref:Amidase family protein n=1 Tax=Luethyella okanaganae TaxID=69372 RepID=A0ABW1VC58_9MICO